MSVSKHQMGQRAGTRGAPRRQLRFGSKIEATDLYEAWVRDPAGRIYKPSNDTHVPHDSLSSLTVRALEPYVQTTSNPRFGTTPQDIKGPTVPTLDDSDRLGALGEWLTCHCYCYGSLSAVPAALFQQYDTDGNGAIDVKEAEQMVCPRARSHPLKGTL
jgi:hypothetical protein